MFGHVLEGYESVVKAIEKVSESESESEREREGGGERASERASERERERERVWIESVHARAREREGLDCFAYQYLCKMDVLSCLVVLRVVVSG